MLINFIFNKINQIKSSKLFFVSPHAYSVGNNSEQLYFALIKASTEGKKVFILYPFDVPFLFRRKLTNNALFNLRAELIYYQNPLIKFLSRFIVSLFMLPARWFDVLINLFGYSLSEAQVIPLVGDTNLYRNNEDSYEFSWKRLDKYNWKDKLETNLNINFSKKDISTANKELIKLGIDDSDWFVCLHVRESGFRNDAGRREYRNSSIENYIPAIKEIIKNGGKVVRLGDSSMKPLPKMKNLIDYPFTKQKSDLMDLYLIKNCKFYIGTSSGIYDTAVLFGQKVLMTNNYMWLHSYPQREHDRGLVKHVYSRKDERFLTLKERISPDWKMQNLWGDIDDNYVLFENSSDDIKNAVEEYLYMISENNFMLTKTQITVNNHRSEIGKQIIEHNKLTNFSERHEIEQKYRFGSRLFSSKGSISSSFTKKYWNLEFFPTDKEEINRLKSLKSNKE
jgi:putative glycosyltransferase (TIGR04372 family)